MKLVIEVDLDHLGGDKRLALETCIHAIKAISGFPHDDLRELALGKDDQKRPLMIEAIDDDDDTRVLMRARVVEGSPGAPQHSPTGHYQGKGYTLEKQK